MKLYFWLFMLLIPSVAFSATVTDNLNAGIPVSAATPLTAVAGTIVAGDGTSFKQTTTPVTPSSNANVIIAASATGKTPLVAQGITSQTADIFQVQDSTGRIVGACSAGAATASGVNVTTWGNGAGSAMTTANNIAVFGSSAGSLNLIGNRNSFFGSLSGTNTTSAENALFGYNSAVTLTSGVNNCVFGSQANVAAGGTNNSCAFGQASSSATQAVAIGAGAQTTGTLSTVIGYNKTTSLAHDLLIGTDNVAIHSGGAAKTMSMEDGVGNIVTALGRANWQTKSAAYPVVQGDGFSHLDVTSSTINLSNMTLPAASTIPSGWMIWIAKADSSANTVPITCNVADAIDGGFAYIDSSNTAPTINGTSTVNRTTTTVTIAMTTNPTTKFVVGGLVTVNLATNTSVNGTWVITSMTASTVVYTDITSGTITNSNDTGTVTGPNTWLSQQHAKLCLMSTGSAGTGASQGWTVVGSQGDWAQGRQTSSTNCTTTAQFTDGALVVLPPGEWYLSAVADFSLNGATQTSSILGISSTSGNSSTGLQFGDNESGDGPATAVSDKAIAIPSFRVVTTFPTIYYEKIQAQFSLGTPQYRCRISAQRAGR